MSFSAAYSSPLKAALASEFRIKEEGKISCNPSTGNGLLEFKGLPPEVLPGGLTRQP